MTTNGIGWGDLQLPETSDRYASEILQQSVDFADAGCIARRSTEDAVAADGPRFEVAATSYLNVEINRVIFLLQKQ